MPSPARVVLTLFLGAAVAASAPARSEAPSATEASYARARQALEAALRAAGGHAALGSVKDVRRSGSGSAYNLGQSLRPDAPLTSRPLEVVSILDFAGKRSRSETKTVAAGQLPNRTVAILSGEGGFAFNELTRVAMSFSTAGLNAARTALRRDPATLLSTASARAETLRHLGEHAFDGRPHAVLTFADSDGAQVALYVDARTSLVSKYEVLADNAVLGDVLNEQVFSDYRAVGGVTLPFRVVSRTAGQVTQELAYADIKVNAGVADALFEAPAGAERVQPLPGAANVTLTPVGDGACFVSGASHNSLLVEFHDHLVLVEAPQGEERAQALIAKIRETVGEKPIRYVVPTHYHFDHSGGLRAFIAAGATIVTTPGNKAFVEKMAAARHTIRLDALSKDPKPARVETFTGQKTFTDGARSLELHDVGPTPHVDEILVAYLPKEKLVFVADLFGIPVQGPIPPAGPTAREFAAKLERLGLLVDAIAPGHGKLGRSEELKKVVETPAPQ